MNYIYKLGCRKLRKRLPCVVFCPKNYAFQINHLIGILFIWRNCYHLANLHSGHVGRTPAAIAYIVYIGKNKLKPISSSVHVQTQEARITMYSLCPHRSNRPKFSFIDTKFGVPFTDKFLKRSSLFITL